MQNFNEQRQLCALVCADVIKIAAARSAYPVPSSRFILKLREAMTSSQSPTAVLPTKLPTAPPPVPVKEPPEPATKVQPSDPPPPEVPPVSPQKTPPSPPTGSHALVPGEVPKRSAIHYKKYASASISLRFF